MIVIIFLGQFLLLFPLNLCFQTNEQQSQFHTTTNIKCNSFFHGDPWPMLKGVDKTAIVKLCQNKKTKDEEGPIVFATLFDTVSRIPIYTANVVSLTANGTEYPRPDSYYWERVSFGICEYDSSTLPLKPIQSLIGHASESVSHQCKHLQAITDDYKLNGLDLDRGHLSPNSINSQDEQKQKGTFTLTNAAPQFADFNRNSWREFECVIEYAVTTLTPEEDVYIVTGTHGTALDHNRNPWWLYSKDIHEKRVKIPKYFWKAACYPGSATKEPWAVAVIQENINVEKTADYRDFMSLEKFSSIYFDDLPFGESCMNAGFGEFATLFDDWMKVVKEDCKASWLKSKDEL